jgi:hypothetical protein
MGLQRESRVSFQTLMKIVFYSLFIVAMAVRCQAADINHAVMVRPDDAPSSARAIKSKLTLVFTDNFNRADGTNLGAAWTEAAHYGVVNRTMVHRHLRFEIPDGHDVQWSSAPWGSATLDLDNSAVLGHGLRPGDYFEITMRRLSKEGMMGVELFDSDQLRVGGDLKPGTSPLQAWNGTTWVPVSVDEHGGPAAFDWNKTHTLGVRFDSADGEHATFSYYLDGHYAGTWVIKTGNKFLDKIGVYAQSKTPGAVVEFSDLRVYCK